jgi:hypothetical protein
MSLFFILGTAKFNQSYKDKQLMYHQIKNNRHETQYGNF